MLSAMLSQQQEAFCQNIADGMTNTAAYRAAYPKCTKDSAAVTCASKLLRIAKIEARVVALREETATARTTSRQEKREFLAQVIRGEVQGDVQNEGAAVLKVSDRINAVKVDNEMTGDNAPIKTKEEKTVNVFIQEKF